MLTSLRVWCYASCSPELCKVVMMLLGCMYVYWLHVRYYITCRCVLRYQTLRQCLIE